MCKTEYHKKPLVFGKQIELLKSRGMEIDVEQIEAEKYLSNYGYYRLSAYSNLFRKTDTKNKIRLDEFINGTSFSEIIKLYEFDSKLRNHLMRAIEKIEISLRTNITHELSTKTNNAFIHYDSCIYHKNFLENQKPESPRLNHGKWMAKIEKQIRGSTDAFIKHYKKKYIDFPKLPLWMFTEILTISELSYFYNGLSNNLKKDISVKFAPFHYKSLTTFFHRLSIVRNICAHHGRLWNREIATAGYLKRSGWNNL